MTKPLFYHDAMQDSFSARIVHVSDDRHQIQLDQTVFYPEGGGQPGDRGTIGGVPVRNTTGNVHDGIVHHLSTPLPEHLEPDSLVEGAIDWGYRYDYMQQHTGQHVLSAALYRVAGASTVSVHQGTDYLTVEVSTPELSPDLLQETEREANKVIAADLPVRAFEVDHQDLSDYSLRRPTSRTGMVRLVEIEGYDLVACGGVHLPRTGLLNAVQSVGVETIRGNVRIAFKIGDRALADYRRTHQLLQYAADLLSSHPDDVPDRVRSMQDELQAQHRTMRLRAERIARMLIPDSLGTREPASLIMDREDEDIFKALGERAAEHPDRRLILLNRGEKSTHWTIVAGASYPLPPDVLRHSFLVPVGAKGGGKPPLWRGIIPAGDRGETSTTAAEAAEAFIKLWD